MYADARAAALAMASSCGEDASCVGSIGRDCDDGSAPPGGGGGGGASHFVMLGEGKSATPEKGRVDELGVVLDDCVLDSVAPIF